MKKITLLFALFFSVTLFSQVTNEGKPASWKLLNNEKSIQTNILPSFDLKALQAEDAINDIDKEGPWRFGYKHLVNFGFEDGQWTTLKNGDRIWRMKFNSPGALSMNVIFDQFFMPEGGKLYLYNDDRTDLLGAYTAIQNQKSGTLGTWIVEGETLWVEYNEPANVKGQGKLHFESITHAYRTAASEREEKGLGDSGNCNHDVDCPIGDDWEAHKENNKKAVAKILSGGSDWCSGALINNTANDGTPYLLTANHCVEGQNPANWAFIFGWISPNPVCATTDNSTNGSTTMTISGASLRAKNAASDFCLVELSSAPPTDWDRTWSGWDRTDDLPNFVVGMHHPSGDIMKICRDDSGPIHTTYSGTAEWEITAAGNGWEIGVTEGGSSGSPLYDPNGRIIGQLHRGMAACSGTNDNDDFDQYGRFATSWDNGSTDATKLQPWLDPLGTNPETLDSYPLDTYALDAGVSITLSEVNCGANTATPTVTLTNFGTTTLTSATLVWNLNGGTNNTLNWTGELVQDNYEMVSLGEVTLTSGLNTINVTVSNPNTGADEDASNNTASVSYNNNAVNTYPTSQVHLHLLTDNFAYETEWVLKNASNEVVSSGGPYEYAESNTNFYYDIDVVTGQCYTFEIIDNQSFDGICCTYGEGMYQLTGDNYAVIASGGDYGAGETTDFAVSEATGVNNLLANTISIYPNPTNGLVNIQLNNNTGNFSYAVVNTVGQQVRQGNLEHNNTSLDLSELTNGVYFMKITNTTNQHYMLKKIVISK